MRRRRVRRVRRDEDGLAAVRQNRTLSWKHTHTHTHTQSLTGPCTLYLLLFVPYMLCHHRGNHGYGYRWRWGGGICGKYVESTNTNNYTHNHP